MHNATDRVNMIAERELPRACAAIGEAVWWITIVDDSLRHGHRTVYDDGIRLCIPNPTSTLLRIRSVGNRIGHEVALTDFIRPIASRPDRGDGRITAWAWNSVPPPTRRDRSEREHSYALKAHKAYEDTVVEGGQDGNIVYTFGLVTGFLDLVHRNLAQS